MAFLMLMISQAHPFLEPLYLTQIRAPSSPSEDSGSFTHYAFPERKLVIRSNGPFISSCSDTGLEG